MSKPPVAAPASGFAVPPRPAALVVMLSGGDAGAKPIRSRAIAHRFHRAGLATLPFELLTAGGDGRFDVPFQAERLVETVRRLVKRPDVGRLTLGLFGDGTGAVALWAAAELGPEVSSVVSLSGRPELAAARLAEVTDPTLLVVGDRDQEGMEENLAAQGLLRCATHLRIIRDATAVHGVGHLHRGTRDGRRMVRHSRPGRGGDMRARRTLMTAAMVALAATGLAGCQRTAPPAVSSCASSVEEETAALDLCAGPAGDGLEGKIAFASDRTGDYEIFVVNGDCRGLTQLTHSPSSDYHPAWSPDGTRIAFTSSEPSDDIFVMNADGSGRTRLTDDPADDHEVSWSPDGSRIAFTSNRTGNYEIFVMNADGTGVTRLSDTPTDDREPAWSPDGTRIAFSGGATGGHGFDPGTGHYDIFVMKADGTGMNRLTSDPADDQNPAWSPDGTKIAWKRDRAGANRLLVMNADASGVVELTSDVGGIGETRRRSRGPSPDGSPAWSPDGTRIGFSSNRTGDTEILVVNADGRGLTKLTDHPAADDEPAWQPRASRPPVGSPPLPVPVTPPLPATT